MSISFIIRKLVFGVGSCDYDVFNKRGGESLQGHNLPQMNKLSQSHLLLQ